MAPEVVFHKNHGPAADYFALGVMLHELLKGRNVRPYKGKNKSDMRNSMRTEVQLTNYDPYLMHK